MAFDFAANEMAPHMAEWDEKVWLCFLNSIQGWQFQGVITLINIYIINCRPTYDASSKFEVTVLSNFSGNLSSGHHEEGSSAWVWGHLRTTGGGRIGAVTS